MAGQPWDAEQTVDPALARRLIREQAPELAVERVELLGEGWDNIVYRVDRDFVFRFPRRQMGADLLETECAVLPRIAGDLPLPVPELTHVGRPTDAFPWPFAGYRYLPGRTACRARLSEEQRCALAKPLGAFLATLHALPADDLPGDTLGRMHVDKRIGMIAERFEKIVSAGLVASADPWRPLLENLPRGARPACLVHGDFYVRHLLVDDQAALTGIIDWGDVHRGDPACDLMIALSFLPPEAAPAFQETYGPLDPPTLRLSLFRALFHAVAITDYGHAIGDADLLREGLRALDRLATVSS